MDRQTAIKTIRHILKRMENEEWAWHEKAGFNEVRGFQAIQYLPNGKDTFTLQFLGPKKPTVIPPITIVWPNGSTEERPAFNMRGLIKGGDRPVYKFCPIDPSTIVPEHHKEKMTVFFLKNNIHTLGSK